MGLYFTNELQQDPELPKMEVTLQMNYILTYWFRTNRLLKKYGCLPLDIIKTIINTFTYQNIFDIEHKYKLKKIEYEQNGPKSTDLYSYNQGQHKYSANHHEYDYLFKMLLIGDVSVGKTSFLRQYVDDTFYISYINTIGVDFKIRTIEMDTKIIKLQIWDTAGQQRFRTITSAYYRGCHGILLFYDITNKQSFENVKKWNDEIERYAPDTVCKILIGNKLDLTANREVLYCDAHDLSKKLNIPNCIEVSAKTAENVEKTVLLLAEQILSRFIIGGKRKDKPFFD